MSDNKKTIFLLLICVIIGFLLRASFLNSKSLWYDEAVSLSIAGAPDIAGVISLCKKAIHPPLYHLLLHFVNFSNYDFIIPRLINIIISLAAILIGFVIGKNLKDNRTGIFIAAAASLSPFAVHYSIELRMYALFWLLSSLQFLFVLRYIKEMKKIDGVFFAISSALALMTHYYAIFPTIGFFAFLFVELLLQKDVRQIKRAAFIPALTFLIFLLWLTTFIEHGRLNSLSGALSLKSGFSVSRFREYFLDFFLGIIPSGVISLFILSSKINTFEILAFIIIAAVLLIRGLFYLKDTPSKAVSNNFRMLLLILLIPLFLTAIHIWLHGRFYSRYLIAYLPAVFFWISEGAAAIKNKHARAALTLIFFSFLFASSVMTAKSDVRDVTLPAVKYICENIPRDYKIIYTNSWSFLPMKHYLTDYPNQFIAEERADMVEKNIVDPNEIIRNSEIINTDKILLIVSEWNFDKKSKAGDFFIEQNLNDWVCVKQTDFGRGLKWIKMYYYEKMKLPR